MPFNRAYYPLDWPEIALAVKADAGWRCTACGRPCRKPGELQRDFIERLYHAIEDCPGRWQDNLPNWETLRTEVRSHPTRYVLTTHHPDHDLANPSARLIALCAPCHLSADYAHHMANARAKRHERHAQITHQCYLKALEAERDE